MNMDQSVHEAGAGLRRELIVGWPKSGTTALFFKVADSLPQKRLQKFFEPRSAADIVEQPDTQWVVAKILITSIGFDRFSDFSHFDRKVWIMRDPRDFLVSRLLYGMYPLAADEQVALRSLALLDRKCRDPSSFPLVDLVREIGKLAPEIAETLAPAGMARRLRNTAAFLQAHRDALFLFRYEDMIDGKWDALEAYLGRAIRRERQVPARWAHVARSLAYGDWRHWFCAADMAAYAQAMDPFLALCGYDAGWDTPPVQQISRDLSVDYVTALMNKERRRLGAADLPCTASG